MSDAKTTNRYCPLCGMAHGSGRTYDNPVRCDACCAVMRQSELDEKYYGAQIEQLIRILGQLASSFAWYHYMERRRLDGNPTPRSPTDTAAWNRREKLLGEVNDVLINKTFNNSYCDGCIHDPEEHDGEFHIHCQECSRYYSDNWRK